MSLPARAQSTTHVVTLSLRSASQTESTSGDLKAAKKTLKPIDVVKACLGITLPDVGVLLDVDCSQPNENAVYIGNVKTGAPILAIGAFDYSLDDAVYTTKSLGPKALTLPFTLTITCVAPNASLSLRGVADVAFKAGGEDLCPQTIKAKLTGVGGTTDLPAFVVDDGSSWSSKKVAFPP